MITFVGDKSLIVKKIRINDKFAAKHTLYDTS